VIWRFLQGKADEIGVIDLGASRREREGATYGSTSNARSFSSTIAPIAVARSLPNFFSSINRRDSGTSLSPGFSSKGRKRIVGSRPTEGCRARNLSIAKACQHRPRQGRCNDAKCV
jgi:hypothetical protein